MTSSPAPEPDEAPKGSTIAIIGAGLGGLVAANALLPAAKALAADIAGTDPGMVQAYKALIDAGHALPFGEALALEHRTSSARNAAVKGDEVEARRRAVIERGRSQV